jgi:uncharacterized caspase-like protein/DNA-binding beta-propeller fold protein YncE
MRRWTAWFLLVSAGCLVGGVVNAGPAAESAEAPVFALDLGAHAGQADRLAISPDERFIVTGARDKSVRVWDAANGQLVRRFYLPVQGADDGIIQSVALAPDGERLAVAGSLRGFGNGKQRAVVIMSVQNGAILKALPGYTANTSALAWSHDGRFLAVGTDADDGPALVDVFAVQDWKKVFTDTQLSGRVSTIAFRSDGRFFATTFRGNADSDVVLYRPEGTGFARVVGKRLRRPGGWRAAWTADEAHFYVGGHSYFDGENLGEPSWTQGRKPPLHENFNHLRQSPDGKRLYGVSYSRGEGRTVLRRWSNATLLGWTEDLELPEYRVTDFAVLKNGTVVYVAEDGTVGAVSPELKLAWRQGRSKLAVVGRPELLKVSADSRWVSLPVEEGKGWREVAFNLETPGFMPAGSIKQWIPPRTHSASMQVLAWQGTRNGAVNGVDFPRRNSRERSLSVAVHGSESALVFGSTAGLVRKLSADGKVLWAKALASNVVGLNLIETKGMVVAATEDGYLRLLRWSDGETLMTFYLLAGERKWLAIADSGHYEASIGAEDLAGWVVNRGREQMADFLSLSRLRTQYQLPGMVQAVWSAGEQAAGISAAQALVGKRSAQPSAAPQVAALPEGAKQPESPVKPETQVADSTLGDAETSLELVAASARVALAPAAIDTSPPVVILRSGLELSVKEPKVTLRFSINTPAGSPVTQIITRVLSAGAATRALQPIRPVKDDKGGEQEISIDLPREDAEVQLIAENAWGASAPASIRVRYIGGKAERAPGKGKLHIVAIGVSQYDNPEYRLGLAAKDAKDFAQTIRQQDGRVYAGVKLTVLTDEAAGKTAVESALTALRSRVKPEDTTMLFLAGHGINDKAGEYLYLPKEASLAKLKETGVSFRLIRDTLATLPGRTLLFVDTCHSGNVLGRERTALRHDNTAAINELASSENNIIVFASSTGNQLSQENDSWGNGAFTKALVEGLTGAADFSRRGRVTYKQLDAYVADRVDALTEGQQTPVTPVLQGVPDFVLAQTRP